jgi:DNA-directed RNA polymerase specialized sigma subunit
MALKSDNKIEHLSHVVAKTFIEKVIQLFTWTIKRLKKMIANNKNYEKRNARIIIDYKAGMDFIALSNKYEVTKNRILQILNDKGVRTRKWTKMGSKGKLNIIKLYAKGLSKSEIGRMVGVSRERVRQIIAEHDAERKN